MLAKFALQLTYDGSRVLSAKVLASLVVKSMLEPIEHRGALMACFRSTD